ncbi:hypothetical protein [Prochlorococcus sp. MIT 0916]|uniref:hypothetical protein n=1 Tax=Prochlorococcus sp. MIT 0916 TaxID=3082521 RepID=UPI0039B5ACD4
MEESKWLSVKEASEVLRVNEKSLEVLRERGYLKPGSHWRSSNDPKQLPWKPKVFYFISGCKEVIEYWQKNNILLLKDQPIRKIRSFSKIFKKDF